MKCKCVACHETEDVANMTATQDWIHPECLGWWKRRRELSPPLYRILGRDDLGERAFRLATIAVVVFALISWVFSCGRAEASMAAGDRGPTLVPGMYNGYFGPWVMKNPGFDRWLMFVSINSAVVKGKPGVVFAGFSGDTGTYNDKCGTWWADRIWVTWHFGDGKDPNGWAEPRLLLGLGGPGEGALIGDPTVVHFGGRWHMYYEGTDRCDGNGARIFHAVADNLFGPWMKTGEVRGLVGNTSGQGFQWPMAFADNHGVMRLYFSDGSARILAAYATCPDGTCFTMSNFNEASPRGPVNPLPALIGNANRMAVAKVGSTYYAVHDHAVADAWRWKELRISTSTDPTRFPKGTTLIQAQAATWDASELSRPCVLYADGEWRVYYTGRSPGFGATIGYYVIGK